MRFAGFRTIIVRLGAPAAALMLGSGLLVTATRESRADVLLTAGTDKKISIWRVSDGKLVRNMQSDSGAAVTAFAACDAAELFATGASDKKIRIWNAGGVIVLTIPAAHEGDVTALAFSRDGKKLYSGGADRRLRVWNVSDGKSLPSPPSLPAPVVGVFVGAGYIVYGGADGGIKAVDTFLDPVEDVATDFKGGLTAMAATTAGPIAYLYAAGADGQIKYFGVDGSAGAFDGAQGCPITAITVLASAQKIVTGGKDGKIKIWDSDKHALLKTIDDAHKGGVIALCASPDSKTIVSSGADNKVKLWDSATYTVVKTIDTKDGPATVLYYGNPRTLDGP